MIMKFFLDENKCLENYMMSGTQAVSHFIPQKDLQCVMPTWDSMLIAPNVQKIFPHVNNDNNNNNNINNKKQKTSSKTLAALLQRRIEILNQLETIVSKQTAPPMKAVNLV